MFNFSLNLQEMMRSNDFHFIQSSFISDVKISRFATSPT